MATLERAIELAAHAHAGQADKGGEPYVLHVLRVMFAVEGEHARMAAVLHDIVEDTPMTLDQLRADGFPEEVVRAVQALTKRPGETRLEAAQRAAQDPIARIVKLADNADNQNLERLPELTDKDVARLREYKKVRALLLAAG